MISSLSSGFLMNYGKRNVLLMTNLVLIVGSGLSQIILVCVQVIGRFIWGMACGVFTVLVPKFMLETAPNELKGPLGAVS